MTIQKEDKGKNKLGKSDMTSKDENGRSRTQIIVAVVGAGGAVLAALVAGIFLIVSNIAEEDTENSRPSTSPVAEHSILFRICCGGFRPRVRGGFQTPH